jgi:hypothetical protein
MKHGDPNVRGQASWPVANPADLSVMALGLQPGLRDGVSSPERLAALRAFAADGGHLSLF